MTRREQEIVVMLGEYGWCSRVVLPGVGDTGMASGGPGYDDCQT